MPPGLRFIIHFGDIPNLVDTCEIEELADVAVRCTVHASVKLEGGFHVIEGNCNNLMRVLV